MSNRNFIKVCQTIGLLYTPNDIIFGTSSSCFLLADVSHETYDNQSKKYFQKENLIRRFFSARDDLLTFLKKEIGNVQDYKESFDDEMEKGFTRVLGSLQIIITIAFSN